jgi:ABC-type polysaccharide/polyol phosphate transport system ATPase subunit
LQIVNLWKKYAWHRAPELSDDELSEDANESDDQLRPDEKAAADDRWVLSGINLTINPGEKVGIIGPNGAGKTTLLNIIAGITLPSNGIVRRKGLCVLLNSLGSPFQGHLSGRKNLHILAALLGADAARLDARLPEIVEFSDMQDMIDRPVREYSRDQYRRLTFATALLLDPEIILSDDLLSVGDARYQERCQELISEKVDKEGVIFIVSSNKMSTIKSFCTRAVWLEDGVVLADGEPWPTANAFLQERRRREATNHGLVSLLSKPPLRAAGRSGGESPLASAGSEARSDLSSAPNFDAPEPHSFAAQESNLLPASDGAVPATLWEQSTEWTSRANKVVRKRLARLRHRLAQWEDGEDRHAVILLAGKSVEYWSERDKKVRAEPHGEIAGLGKIDHLKFDFTYADQEAQYSRLSVGVQTFVADVEIRVAVDHIAGGTHIFTCEMPESYFSGEKRLHSISLNIPNYFFQTRVTDALRSEKRTKLTVRLYLRKPDGEWSARHVGSVRLRQFGSQWSPPFPYPSNNQGPLLLPDLQWDVESGVPASVEPGVSEVETAIDHVK